MTSGNQRTHPIRRESLRCPRRKPSSHRLRKPNLPSVRFHPCRIPSAIRNPQATTPPPRNRTTWSKRRIEPRRSGLHRKVIPPGSTLLRQSARNTSVARRGVGSFPLRQSGRSKLTRDPDLASKPTGRNPWEPSAESGDQVKHRQRAHRPGRRRIASPAHGAVPVNGGPARLQSAQL